jgi:alcohol dehydrogenase
VDTIREQTEGLGADVAVEAVGIPETFELCTAVVRSGGRVANVGVHGRPATLHLESLWIKNLTITTGLVDTFSTPTLLRMLASGQLSTHGFLTHRFGLDEMLDACETFSAASATSALKVVLTRT